jgi:membrane-bound ClpP family serine protease
MTDKRQSSKLKPWLIVLIALLDDITVLVLVFLLLWIFNVDIPLAAIVVIGVVAGVFVFVIHRALVPSLRKKQEVGSEAMIGLTGEVTQKLAPKGVIKVKGEYWQAKCTGENIETGEEVEIIGIDRLVLEVRRRTS